MREYLPYILMAAALVGLYVYRSGGLGAIFAPALPSTATVSRTRYITLPAPAPPDPVKLDRPEASPNLTTAADAFALAHRLAREEANIELSRRFAEEAGKAAAAIYSAPFSGPPVTDKPAA